MNKLIIFTFLFSLCQLSYSQDYSGMGELQYKGNLPGEWMYVVGKKDTMMLSKTGRFSIVSHDGVLRITDLWKEQSITFKEMAERFDQYPIREIAQKNQYKPLKLGDPKKPSKYTVFLMLGDKHSIDFFKEAQGNLTSSGADLYILAGQNIQSFYAYTCGSIEMKIEILKGLDTSIGSDNCNQSAMIRKGTAVRAAAELLRIKRVPFAIINDNDNGAVVNYKTFGSLK